MNIKYFKRKVAILLAAALVLLPICETTYAFEGRNETNLSSEDKTTEREHTEELVKKYGLKICEIPEGVTPIVVNSEEELQEVLREFNEISNEVESSDYNNIRLARAASTSKSLKYSKKIGMGANFNVYGDVHVSNKKITKVTGKGQSLTGYTLGLHLVKGPTTANIASSKKSVTLKARGTINMNILVNGIGTVASKDHTVTGTYKIK
ncbi:hypothetical protein [Metaclostridioides mangenotii]|uniref:hypothetical protein n=1 Tax=Metaclostridioides mangenotii TaxID=1540 RepID=UPI00046576BA|nr:hypothetical protein [Clostridioides mangenotii]